MKHQVHSGTPWEDIGGYCRAIKVGNIIEVAGTTSMDGDKLVGKNDVTEQTRFILNKIQKAIEQLGGSLKDIVRTRMFVTNIEMSADIIKVHGEFFKHIKPVSSMIGINQLIHPDLLIEIEATAIIETN